MPVRARVGSLLCLVLLTVIVASLMWLPAEAAPTPPLTSRQESAGAVQCAAPVEPPRDDPAPQSLPSTTAAICPSGMVLVDGDYCPTVAQRCVRYLSEERDRCAEYAPGGACFGAPIPERFCIDRFEYPNRRGLKPMLAITWMAAVELCEAEGKRLCTDREWTLACEGDGRLPYPYGNVRDSTACNIDRPYRMPDNSAYADPQTRSLEVARLDQSEPSGSRSACVSPHGVYDMTGNVDEWVTNTKGYEHKAPYISGLKGGYWGPVRNRCRPITTDHNQWHSGYQIGFRCCSDPPPRTLVVAGVSEGLWCSLR